MRTLPAMYENQKGPSCGLMRGYKNYKKILTGSIFGIDYKSIKIS
jgi:hypothetical protein